MEENGIDIFYKLYKVYQTGDIPKDWLTSVFIPIAKKLFAKKCEEQRTKNYQFDEPC